MPFLQFLRLISQYIVLGFVQGFTEPIPVSSSGHLVIVQRILGIGTGVNNFSFEILVNFASLIAVVIVYWDDIVRLAVNGFNYLFKQEQASKPEFDFIIYLIIGTIPAGVIGILFDDLIAETFGAAKMVGISLIVTGIALWVIRNLRGNKNEGEITLKDAIIVGLAQSVALIPGISRSGATIVAAMLLGMKQKTALRFSFLLYIPVSLGSFILSVNDLFNDQFSTLWLPYLFSFITAAIATYFALRWFMNIMAKGNLIYFSIYCFILGTFAFIIL
ncbi:undecaprenyl-diphosphatase [Amphibacillus marinus]|uniref:Undecaprenyl-diphosphatase n=1 Tax=Amphibacillus marinus TaxID=872970 RepID=A0A1H8Q879_9BACI|nr:undecaprenyl-diphosphatase UppP [Amphibacillus marinus]SEO50439.1 undecaprenyl-diphosphatase [Amphibacillus marinus]